MEKSIIVRGTTKNFLPDDIAPYFSKFGFVEQVLLGGGLAIITFSNPKSAKVARRWSPYYVNEATLTLVSYESAASLNRLKDMAKR